MPELRQVNFPRAVKFLFPEHCPPLPTEYTYLGTLCKKITFGYKKLEPKVYERTNRTVILQL